MRILQVHNFYQQAGGEDRVVESEEKLLAAHGHTVFRYNLHNNAVDNMSALALGIRTVWNQETYRKVRKLVAQQGIELVHAHNTLPLISPALYYAAAAEGAAIVQTLHNYRLLCPAATFYRQGKTCELCLHKSLKYPAVKHRCYRGSLLASAAVGTMLGIHHISGTYQRKIHTYIALTEFARAKFCEGGLPPESIAVKPNFVADDPGAGAGNGGYALFAGRLSEEKGLAILLDSWAAAGPAIPLKIAGDGPMQTYVRERAAALPGVTYLGACNQTRVTDLLKEAAFLVFPSRWYEGMPMAALEAMACGTPVVAFAIGAMNDLIVDGRNGIKLGMEDPRALADCLKHSNELLEKLAALRTSARTYFERHFTAPANYEMLIRIYQRALKQRSSLS